MLKMGDEGHCKVLGEKTREKVIFFSENLVEKNEKEGRDYQLSEGHCKVFGAKTRKRVIFIVKIRRKKGKRGKRLSIWWRRGLLARSKVGKEINILFFRGKRKDKKEKRKC